MINLKPCPFCKGTYLGCLMRDNPYDYLHEYVAFIFCHRCGAEGKKAKMKDELDKEMQLRFAAECWNERYMEDAEE